LSFHATKFLNTFEGGAVLTDDDALAAKIRLMKNFGFSGYDNVIYIGINGKMSEISAAMGLTGLESIDDIIAANRGNYEGYRKGLSGVEGIRLVEYDDRERCNYQYVVLELDEAVAGVSRDTLVDVLHAENVIARRYFHPGAHRMEPYRSHFPHAGLVLPETERLAARVISLPTGTSIGEREVETICSILRIAVEHGPKIGGRLS
ncbi:MAG: dTDP-4-dehydro-6-deoxyglucose aminotransferase, partial [Deltaproteobacteria bacterium]|nr:dTDP-4-dehydro-6-deoxyglucose aminotransferase [Deltaproteobacteria bacterium]